MDKLFAAHLRQLNRQLPKQAIVGFRKEGSFQPGQAPHWVAELKCGHLQLIRHQPPLFNRPWLITQVGRAAMLGCLLACKQCARPKSN